ncbi:MAG: response regulator [Planctomycetota bacterium]|jgi:CheY-like chemotaxis protein
MNEDAIILLAEDDRGHIHLIEKNLKRAGINNEIICFDDGKSVLDFLRMKGDSLKRQPQKLYVLLLDIRMPVMDGVEVLKRIEGDAKLKNLPVIMLTTTDEPKTIEQCYKLGCLNYIVKPANFEIFIEAIQNLAQFLRTIKIPAIQ